MTELGELSSFIHFLKEEYGFNFNLNSFEHRFRLQKYVFLAKSFGWQNDYSYNVYLRGPYSKDLAEHYYSFKEIRVDDIPPISLRDFNKKSFLDLIGDKGEFWLESASTIISIMDNYRHYYRENELKKKVLERVIELKNNIPQKIIENAFSDLSDANILPVG